MTTRSPVPRAVIAAARRLWVGNPDHEGVDTALVLRWACARYGAAAHGTATGCAFWALTVMHNYGVTDD